MQLNKMSGAWTIMRTLKHVKKFKEMISETCSVTICTDRFVFHTMGFQQQTMFLIVVGRTCECMVRKSSYFHFFVFAFHLIGEDLRKKIINQGTI